jgi:hypothetical protein
VAYSKCQWLLNVARDTQEGRAYILSPVLKANISFERCVEITRLSGVCHQTIRNPRHVQVETFIYSRSNSTASKRWITIVNVMAGTTVLCQMAYRGACLSKKDEVLEARVQMGLSFKVADLTKMRVVNVGIHSEQALENSLDDVHEIGWKS